MDLKPCPWCSGEALVESVPRIFGNRKDKMYLYRVACVRIGCTVNPATKWQNSVGVAVVAWNTRADEERIRREAIEECITVINQNTPMEGCAGCEENIYRKLRALADAPRETAPNGGG